MLPMQAPVSSSFLYKEAHKNAKSGLLGSAERQGHFRRGSRRLSMLLESSGHMVDDNMEDTQASYI